jgi:hypothetical protein
MWWKKKQKMIHGRETLLFPRGIKHLIVRVDSWPGYHVRVPLAIEPNERERMGPTTFSSNLILSLSCLLHLPREHLAHRPSPPRAAHLRCRAPPNSAPPISTPRRPTPPACTAQLFSASPTSTRFLLLKLVGLAARSMSRARSPRHTELARGQRRGPRRRYLSS